jgi:hypothetical protein
VSTATLIQDGELPGALCLGANAREIYRDPSHHERAPLMLRIALLIPSASTPAVVSRWGAKLRHAWQQLTLDDDERFLCEARDLADLESRLRRLERGRVERFRPLPPGP